MELAAQVIRGVEAHKTTSAFLLFAAVCGCNMPRRAGCQWCWRPNCSTRVILVAVVNLAGLASALVGGSDVQGPAV
jgi:hypothetical protein